MCTPAEQSLAPTGGLCRNRSRFAALLDTLFKCTLALAPAWAVGQIARDSTWLTGLCFYIPSAFLAVVLPVWAVINVARKRRRAAALAACLAIPPLAFVLLVENCLFSDPPTVAPGYLRLVHWNVAGALSRPGASDVLLAQHADLYVLSEVPNARAVEAFREALGPDYQAQVFGNLAVVGAGSVRADSWLLEREGAKFHSVTWERGGDRAALLVVDLPSRIDVARDPLLREVNGLIERYRPDLVVGDFNAPRRSRALCELPAGYGHAYNAVGSGFGYTWPVPAPMYALDQCIHSARLVPARYELSSSRLSDHRLQVFDFFCSSGG